MPHRLHSLKKNAIRADTKTHQRRIILQDWGDSRGLAALGWGRSAPYRFGRHRLRDGAPRMTTTSYKPARRLEPRTHHAVPEQNCSQYGTAKGTPPQTDVHALAERRRDRREIARVRQQGTRSGSRGHPSAPWLHQGSPRAYPKILPTSFAACLASCPVPHSCCHSRPNQSGAAASRMDD